jgi:hypothetical protein
MTMNTANLTPDQQAAAIVAFAKANPETAREIFNGIIAQESDADRRAALELFREYTCNPAFAAALSQYVWELNAKA